MAIAPEDPRVQARVLAACSSDDVSVRNGGREALRVAPRAVQAALIPQVGADVLLGFAKVHPERVKARCLALLDADPRMAMVALSRLPPDALGQDVTDAVVDHGPPPELMAMLPRDPRLAHHARSFDVLAAAEALRIHGDVSDVPRLRALCSEGSTASARRSIASEQRLRPLSLCAQTPRGRRSF